MDATLWKAFYEVSKMSDEPSLNNAEIRARAVEILEAAERGRMPPKQTPEEIAADHRAGMQNAPEGPCACADCLAYYARRAPTLPANYPIDALLTDDDIAAYRGYYGLDPVPAVPGGLYQPARCPMPSCRGELLVQGACPVCHYGATSRLYLVTVYDARVHRVLLDILTEYTRMSTGAPWYEGPRDTAYEMAVGIAAENVVEALDHLPSSAP